MLFVLKYFSLLQDDQRASRISQILFYLTKLFNFDDFMNYFLLDLIIFWFCELCAESTSFLKAVKNDHEELINTMSAFNKKLSSIEKVQNHGIIFSIEGMGYFGILENTQKNSQIDEILRKRYVLFFLKENDDVFKFMIIIIIKEVKLEYF